MQGDSVCTGPMLYEGALRLQLGMYLLAHCSVPALPPPLCATDAPVSASPQRPRASSGGRRGGQRRFQRGEGQVQGGRLSRDPQGWVRDRHNASPRGTPRADCAWDSGVCGETVCICSRTAPFPPYPLPLAGGGTIRVPLPLRSCRAAGAHRGIRTLRKPSHTPRAQRQPSWFWFAIRRSPVRARLAPLAKPPATAGLPLGRRPWACHQRGPFFVAVRNGTSPHCARVISVNDLPRVCEGGWARPRRQVPPSSRDG